jgi:hypothetical protein
VSPRKAFERITAKARAACLAVVTAEIRRHLPQGWRCVLAVGWGVTVFDAAGDIVGGHAHIKPLPARLAKAVALAEEFGDIYGLGNEQVIPA